MMFGRPANASAVLVLAARLAPKAPRHAASEAAFEFLFLFKSQCRVHVRLVAQQARVRVGVVEVSSSRSRRDGR
jgi:hypothetical protein